MKVGDVPTLVWQIFDITWIFQIYLLNVHLLMYLVYCILDVSSNSCTICVHEYIDSC
jgi:hypothetical protein